MRFFAILLFAALAQIPRQAAAHPCDEDATARAGALLKLHWQSEGSFLADAPGEADPSGDAQPWDLDRKPVEVSPIHALVGSGQLDVLEITGYVYRASYRMHFIYAQIPDYCLLMGQEILEVSDPY